MNQKLSRLLAIVAVALSAAAVPVMAAGWAMFGTSDLTEAAAPGGAEFAALDSTLAITANCRFGTAGTQPYVDFISGQGLGIGWNMDFGHDYRNVQLPGSEYVNLIRTLEDKDGNFQYLDSYTISPPLNEGGLGAAIARQPGALWMVGNEPDRGPNVPTDTNRVQDDSKPQIYARMYHDAYQFIKAHDPTAQVAVAGLVEVTPGRLQYLDMVWDTYLSLYGTPMPVDVWNMHLYVLPEANHEGTAPDEIANIAKGTSLALALKESNFDNDSSWCTQLAYVCLAAHDDINSLGNQWNFSRQVVAMRSWMQSHNQQNKPLILSEFGQLYPCLNCDGQGNPDCFPRDEYGACFTPARSAAFLNNSFNYLYNATDAALGYPLDNYRLVQQSMWFSLSYEAFYNSNLVTPTTPMALTLVGTQYRNTVQSISQTINLMARSTRQVGIQHGGDHVTATVAINVLNNGNIAPGTPTAITVYADAARTQPLGTGYLTGAKGCARQEATAYVSFPLPVKWITAYTYYVRVDPGNALSEPTMADNDISGIVLPDPHPIYVPVIRR